ncbi:DUF4832 domain-containing protein [Candidatus Bathyarchaeota archaeon]|nr:DUF4832 domain-containing protein [Candidatus Bathyarchaeota archaeon]MBS7617059.1 DUF4832 domain-containing protein [Candidatus Bathyarchaeota archaeon]
MPEESRVRVIPEEIDDLLANPDMGLQTFHCFADEDKSLEGLPSTSAYFRFYWSEIEPVEGNIDFQKFNYLLSRARKAGQRLAFRIMCIGTGSSYMYVPHWLKEKGCRGFEYQRGESLKHWAPDMDDPIFQDAHFRLLEELGKRYDGHPDLGLVDVGSVGLWGEWHMSGTGLSLPSLKTRLAIIDAYCETFPKTPKLMNIDDEDGMRYAIRKGCGWRADCLGDMGGFSKNWNHMEHFYPQQISRTGAGEAWKTMPVAFESCWDMKRWRQEGWDIRYIFDYALKYHVSYFNNKSTSIPENTRHEVEYFLRRIGYRLVLRKLEHDKVATLGSLLLIRMMWENVGVAPPYKDNLLAFRLKNLESKDVKIFISQTSIKGWTPGKIEVTTWLRLPEDLKPGLYELAIAIVDPDVKIPAVRLAIAGHSEDGWYPLSQVEVKDENLLKYSD